MSAERRKILDACFNGDFVSLEMVFYESQIRSDHPRFRQHLDRRIPMDNQPPYVELMLQTAITGHNYEAISFLCAMFPGCKFDGLPMKAAIDSGDVTMLRTVCKLDPAAANKEVGEQTCVNALAYACSKPNAAELITVLLEAGADPNRAPTEAIGIRCLVSTAVLKGLPPSTFEQFFEAGYDGWESRAVELAVAHNRGDVVSVLLSRSVHLANSRFPPKKQLMKEAKKQNNPDMMAAIKWTYACRSNRERGTSTSCFSSLKCW